MNQNTEIKQSHAVNANAALIQGDIFERLERFAVTMASGKCTVPDHLRGNKGDCFAVAMQALQWGMNPFAVGQKTHLVNGTLGYEAQLVNAVISSSKAIVGRFHYEYGGDWEKLAEYPPKKVKKERGQGPNKKTYYVYEKGWPDELEKGLSIKVGAQIAGESDVTYNEPLYLASIVTRNSELWATDPKQQIAYLGVKKWSRKYTPAVIMGVYTPDEIENDSERVVKDVTEQSENLNDKLNKKRQQQSYTLEKFKVDLANATSDTEIKECAAKARTLPANDHGEANALYKVRVAEIREQLQAKENKVNEGSPAITKETLLADVAKAKNQDELDLVADLLNTLPQSDQDEIGNAIDARMGELHLS